MIERNDNRTAAPEKRPFVKPELRREAKLPEITNSFVGSFNPEPGDSTQTP